MYERTNTITLCVHPEEKNLKNIMGRNHSQAFISAQITSGKNLNNSHNVSNLNDWEGQERREESTAKRYLRKRTFIRYSISD